ncbi:MAG: DUF4397 domain-containing protein [Leadbetterella sp.]
MKNNIHKFLLTISLASVGLLYSCESTDYPDAKPSSTSTSATSARMMFVNAVADGSNFNFLINNNEVAKDVAAFKNSPYVNITTGATQVRANGASNYTVVYRDRNTNQNPITIAPNSVSTVFIIDSLKRAAPVPPNTATVFTDRGGSRMMVVTDVLTTTATDTLGKFRFFHLAPDAPAVWVSFLRGTTSVASIANRAYISPLTTAGSLTNAGTFANIARGSYTVEVRTGSATGPVALTIPNVQVAAGKFYTFYARGLLRARTLGVEVITHN